MNSSFYNNKQRSFKKTGQFIIKNTPPTLTAKKIPSSDEPKERIMMKNLGPAPINMKEPVRIKPELTNQAPSEYTANYQAKPQFPFDRIQRNVVKEETDPRRIYAKAKSEMDEFITSQPSVNLDDYVTKAKYEELQKKFDQLTRKHEEVRLRNRHMDNECKRVKAKNQDLLEENNRLKERIREMEEQRATIAHNRDDEEEEDNEAPNYEEAKMDDNELRSLRLAMRYEAENILLNHISQLAGLQTLYDRIQPQADLNDPNNINPDNMTYEELLQLEERIGKVSKGMTIEDIKKIKKFAYKKPLHSHHEETCSICFNEVENGAKMRKLPCSHEYHSKCIKQWLLNEKTCPICKTEVTVS